VKIEFDPAKNARNIAEHGVSFERSAQFEWETALVAEDTRKQYPERRFEGIGYVGGAAARPDLCENRRWHSGYQFSKGESQGGEAI